jgi:hypothetical protein
MPGSVRFGAETTPWCHSRRSGNECRPVSGSPGNGLGRGPTLDFGMHLRTSLYVCRRVGAMWSPSGRRIRNADRSCSKFGRQVPAIPLHDLGRVRPPEQGGARASGKRILRMAPVAAPSCRCGQLGVAPPARPRSRRGRRPARSPAALLSASWYPSPSPSTAIIAGIMVSAMATPPTSRPEECSRSMSRARARRLAQTPGAGNPGSRRVPMPEGRLRARVQRR